MVSLVSSRNVQPSRGSENSIPCLQVYRLPDSLQIGSSLLYLNRSSDSLARKNMPLYTREKLLEGSGTGGQFSQPGGVLYNK
jgi:hypothetical protein